MSSRRFYRRRFPNKRGHHAGAYVLADCAVETFTSESEVSAYLTIADCRRLATLSFDVRSRRRPAARPPIRTTSGPDAPGAILPARGS